MYQDEELDGSPRGGLGLLIVAVVLTAFAAGMGWGIRGQYGHETGAMIAGALASLTLVMLFVPCANSLAVARVAAMMTIGIGIGGSMTYGQTVGLTHDRELIGHGGALMWGMLGLMVKGGIWIGFGATLVGMGLSRHQYRPLEIGLLFLSLLGLYFVGVWLLNSPFDPSNKLLPRIYFSDHWYFEPDRGSDNPLKPRRECWGGFCLALVSLTLYVRCVRGDRLAARMAIVGVIAGALGFSGGQAVQATANWNPEFYTGRFFWFLEGVGINWWNMMETTFGLIFGAILGAGLWCNRHLIGIDQKEQSVSFNVPIECLLLALHIGLLMLSEFYEFPKSLRFFELYTDLGLLMTIIPLIGVVGGRLWPYFMVLPVVTLPIAGKTIRHLCFNTDYMPVAQGWLWFVLLPVGVMSLAAWWLSRRGTQGQSGGMFASIALALSTLCYFGLNTAFFDFAWPWLPEWTGRTPNQTIFLVCATCLLIASLICGVTRWVLQREEEHEPLIR